MKISEYYFKKACVSPDTFKKAINIAKENERELIIEKLNKIANTAPHHSDKMFINEIIEKINNI